MAGMLLLHILAIPVFCGQLLRALPAEGWRHVWKRLPLFMLAGFGFCFLNVVHLAGHLLDEVFFHGYRKTRVDNPVFVLGIPRSGTTHLQRMLIRHPDLTTFTLWEALLAPSITERYLYRAIGTILRPLESGVRYLRRRLFHHMDKIHHLGLLQPEEDFLLLLPVLGCLLPAFACPRSAHYWRLGFFDHDVSGAYRGLLLDFYHRCLQKHVYYHGGGLRVLSKNPSFTPLLGSILQHFPDARIVACTRAPAEVVPSQLSALRPAMTVLGSGKLSTFSQDRMLELLQHYYATLGKFAGNPSLIILPIAELTSATERKMSALLEFLSLSGDKAFIHYIHELDQAPPYRSGHRYGPEQFALTDQDIETLFRDVWPLPESIERDPA